MSSNNNSTLFLVGGTGKLGNEIAKGLVKAEGFSNFVALVRPSSVLEKASLLQDMGWSIEGVDCDDTEALTDIMKNRVKVVVSTLGGPDMFALERNVIQAAKVAGASLFVPSQFGVDFRRWKGIFPFYEKKKALLEYAKKEIGLPTLAVFTGFFSDIIFFAFTDLQTMHANLVNGGTAKCSFTRRSDIGFVLAKALNDPKYCNGGYLSMQGDSMTWREALSAVEVATGKTFTFQEVTPDEALSKEKELLSKGDFVSFRQAFCFHVLREMANGSTGAFVGDEAQAYEGIEMESLAKTLESVFGKELEPMLAR